MSTKMKSPAGSAPPEEQIADAVLDWLVKRGALDAGAEYHAADVISALNDLIGLEDVNLTQASNEKLKSALRFYANPAVYAPHPHGPAFDRRDISYRAKNVLAEVGDDELPPNYAACCNSTDLAACDCVNKQHIRVLFAR